MQENPKEFDPEKPGSFQSGIFGLPFEPEDSQIILLGAPWGVTLSYKEGAQNGPQIVLEASDQLDYFDEDLGEIWRYGINLEILPLAETSTLLRKTAKRIIDALVEDETLLKSKHFQDMYALINNACHEMLQSLERNCEEYLDQSKIVGLIGGDHSVSLGLISALTKKHDSFGILQIDAHADLRIAYEGFEYSHASIMHHCLSQPQISKLVQVGIRDFSALEAQTILLHSEKIHAFTSRSLHRKTFEGMSWREVTDEIVSVLPEKVYLSLDIDGLEPALCPGTGTPVPGGLSYEKCVYLLNSLQRHGKTIIGFDIVEVAGISNPLNGNIAARLLYLICGLAASSQNKPLIH